MAVTKSIFPVAVRNDIVNLTRGKSSIARLAGVTPVDFAGTDIFTFSFDNRASIVGENEAKSVGGVTMAPVQIMPFKVEYGARVTDEFMIASEERKLNILKEFRDGFAKELAFVLDVAAFHGYSPRSGQASTVIGNNNLDYVIANYNSGANVVTYDSSDPNANMEAAIAKVMDAEHEVTGAAFAPSFRSALATQTKSNGDLMFPELAWGNKVQELRGLAIDSNYSVSFGGSKDKAIVGNFRDFFKWGVAKDMFFTVIQYGDPDNTGVDLAGHNQVYLRGEAYIGYGIITPAAFALVKQGE
ncbi:MAG: phage major capsid protein [Methanosphaera sp.]|nr:phage major capsid protein [Methanosphaera sp.]